MRQVQEGDFASFEALVHCYRPALVRVASGMLGDVQLAEDVAQDAFLAVFAARHTYNPSFSFRTWLWTILLNLCRRHCAKRARRPREIARSALECERDFGISDPASAETGLAAVIFRERSAQLQLLLNELPDVEADAIRLRFFAGLTHNEIARSMGISLGGAKLRVRRGLTALSRRLRESGELP